MRYKNRKNSKSIKKYASKKQTVKKSEDFDFDCAFPDFDIEDYYIESEIHDEIKALLRENNHDDRDFMRLHSLEKELDFIESVFDKA